MLLLRLLVLTQLVAKGRGQSCHGDCRGSRFVGGPRGREVMALLVDGVGGLGHHGGLAR